jgi:hypothetical protein
MTNNDAPGATSSDAEASRGQASDQRLSARRPPGLSESLRRVRSRTGREFDVVDVSDTGLLIEGQARLLPTTHVDLHIVTRTGRVLVRCRVVRSFVWYLEGDLVRYRVGLSFDHRVDTSAGYPVLGEISANVEQTGTRYPASTLGTPGDTLRTRLA